VAFDDALSALPMLPPAGFESRRHGTLRVALCDTDFLMNQVKDTVNPATSLLSGFKGIRQRAYAAQHVFDELYGDDGHGHATKWHKLSDQARDAGVPVPESTFRDAFETRFVSDIGFVHMGDMFAEHPLVMGVRTVRSGRGTSDAPTAQLAVLLSRLHPVVYSHDEHLYKPGVAPRPRHLPVVRGAENQIAQGEHVQLGAIGVTVGSVAGVDYLARTVGGLFGSPTWLSRLVALGLGAWTLLSPEHRAAAGRILVPIGEALLWHLERTYEALTLLDSSCAAVEPSGSIEARIAEALVRRAKDGPLLAKEIQHELTLCDPSLVDVPTIEELRAVLSIEPCFEVGPRWRYSLGHRSAREGAQEGQQTVD